MNAPVSKLRLLVCALIDKHLILHFVHCSSLHITSASSHLISCSVLATCTASPLLLSAFLTTCLRFVIVCFNVLPVSPTYALPHSHGILHVYDSPGGDWVCWGFDLRQTVSQGESCLKDCFYLQIFHGSFHILTQSSGVW